MKKMLVTLLAVICAASAYAAPVKVGISQIVEHPALDATRKGIIDAVSACGFAEGKDVIYDVQIAQGNVATANQIAKKFVGDKDDLVIGIATPNSQALKQVVEKSGLNIPVIFSAVTDPVGAKLVQSIEKTGGNITGVSDLTPVKAQLEVFKEFGIKVKTIGILYNPGEQNSRALVDLAKAAAKELGIKIIDAPVTNSSGVYMAAKSLVGRADGMYVPTDNTVVSALESAVQVSYETNIPLIMGDTDSVVRGALAAKGFNYYKHGVQTGQIVCRILKGEKAENIPVEFQQDLELYVNLKAAKEMGVKVPEAVIKSADKVIE
ncbi:ABC transporter substrate-binding protein [Geovibrio sp. ADMFC3]|jgi:putative ABC transport system substrate-binding protein|nr:ABC transporter permease [Deferribacteraceae bacterium]